MDKWLKCPTQLVDIQVISLRWNEILQGKFDWKLAKNKTCGIMCADIVTIDD